MLFPQPIDADQSDHVSTAPSSIANFHSSNGVLHSLAFSQTIYPSSLNDEELERFRLQHSVFQELLGKYPPILADIMADDAQVDPKACLDLGCGSGEWIMEVAREFPKCRALAVDVVPVQSHQMPPNLRSEVDDINLGLEHHYGKFNVVHARHVVPGIRDFRGLIDQISHVLRPGGLVSLAEFDFLVYDGNKKPIKVDTVTFTPPWWPLWLELAAQTIRKRGGSTEVAPHLVRWVTEHVAFENVSSQEYWIQVAPVTAGDDPLSVRQRRISGLIREDMKAFMKSSRHMLLESCLPESVVDKLEQDASQELTDARSPRYIRLQVVHALKRQHYG